MTKTGSENQVLCESSMQASYISGYTLPSPTASDSRLPFSACTLVTNFADATFDRPVFGEFCAGTGEVMYAPDGCGKLLRQIVLSRYATLQWPLRKLGDALSFRIFAKNLFI